MNEKILISYIIPAYNAADTLERAVEKGLFHGMMMLIY